MNFKKYKIIPSLGTSSKELTLATAQEIENCEKTLNFSFENDYKQYVTTYGEGTLGGTYIRIYLPNRILKDMTDWKARIEQYWFWDNGKDVLTKEQALSAVIVGDTLGGDEILYFQNQYYILPHGVENIFCTGKTLENTIEWLCTSGVCTEPFKERQFEPFLPERIANLPKPDPAIQEQENQRWKLEQIHLAKTNAPSNLRDISDAKKRLTTYFEDYLAWEKFIDSYRISADPNEDFMTSLKNKHHARTLVYEKNCWGKPKVDETSNGFMMLEYDKLLFLDFDQPSKNKVVFFMDYDGGGLKRFTLQKKVNDWKINKFEWCSTENNTWKKDKYFMK